MPPGSELLITGSADLSLRVWAVDKGGTGAMPWAHLATLQGHKGAVTDVCVHLLHPCEQQQGAAQGQSPPSFLLVSTAGDSEVGVRSTGVEGGAVCACEYGGDQTSSNMRPAGLIMIYDCHRSGGNEVGTSAAFTTAVRACSGRHWFSV
eukprot:1161623-Pelagomonas_calceolata.AAC.4